ncbi:MAG: prepilin-type N-terminal cleavage/methylation domain-containing protein [Acidobacteriota bacterium]
MLPLSPRHPASGRTACADARALVPRLAGDCELGFTLVELLVVVGLVGVLSAISVMMMPGVIASAKADGGADRVVAALRVAREQAISQRRMVLVAFTAPNQLVTSRVDVPGPGTTVIDTVLLEDGMSFQLFPGLPDTPDAFTNATATSFGLATTIGFSSEGSFVDQNGDPVNGTVFIGKSNQSLTARAVSLFGPTALIRKWRWNGRQWTS